MAALENKRDGTIDPLLTTLGACPNRTEAVAALQSLLLLLHTADLWASMVIDDVTVKWLLRDQ